MLRRCDNHYTTETDIEMAGKNNKKLLCHPLSFLPKCLRHSCIRKYSNVILKIFFHFYNLFKINLQGQEEESVEPPS